MSADSKDFELRVRARDYSQKTLAEVTEALRDLGKAQEEQLAAAKKGESSAKSLETSYRNIENAVRALASQGALTKTFEAQNRALEEAKRRVEEARLAQEAYARSMVGVDKASKDQVQTQRSLATAVAVAERAQLRAQARVEGTVAKLKEFGIAADNVAAAQRQIVAAVGQGNVALERQEAAIQSLDGDLRTYRASQDAATQSARDAKAAQDALRQSQEVQVSNVWNQLLDEREAREKAVAAAVAARAAEEKRLADIEATTLRQMSAAAQQQLAVERQDIAAAQARSQAYDREQATLKAQRDALTKAADAAIAASRGYQTLARSITQVRGNDLANQIKGIIDPAGQAVKTLSGLSSAIGAVEQKVASIKGPVKDYRETLGELEAAQRSINSIAGQVDGYRRQIDAVRTARAEYALARDRVRELAEQMRAGIGGSEITQQMTSAQSALQRAAVAMQTQTQRARDLRTALKAAGVATNDLTGAEQQLIGQAGRSTNAVNQLSAAYQRYGAEVKKADAASREKWLGGGRTTLSWMQRIRGELLGIATAYVGVQAGINLAKGSLDAFRSSQSIESRLGAMVGNDPAKIAEEWQYLMGQADRLGFEFEKVAGSYAKFGIAAKATGFTLQDTRFIFEQIAASARTLRLNTDELDGVMKALEQMMSKGAIQAEELRGQLGDRLPGAMALAAKGAGVTIAEFGKMMEQGQVGAEFVINLAREMGKEYGGIGDAAKETGKTLRDADAAFKNAAFGFQLALAKGGFVDAYTEFLTKLTALLQSSEGQQLAQQLSAGFTAIVQLLQWAAENTDTLKVALSVLIGLQVGRWLVLLGTYIVPLISSFGLLVTAVRTMNVTLAATPAAVASIGTAAGVSAGGVGILTGAVGLLAGAFKILARSIPVLGAAFVAYEVYDALANKKGDAEKAGEEVGKAYAKGFTGGASGSFGDAGAATPDPGTGGSQSTMVAKAISATLDKSEKKLAKDDARSRMKGAKKELDERLSIAAEEYEALKQQAETQITDAKLKADTLARIELSLQKRLTIERRNFQNAQVSSDESAAAKRARLAREVADELERIQDDLAKREAAADPNATFEERMKTRLDAIAHEYDKLGRKIEQMKTFDPKGSAEARKRVDEYIKQRQEVEAIKVKQEELSRLEKELGDQTQLRSSKLGVIQAQYQAGELTQDQLLAKTMQVNDEMETGIGAAAAKLRDFAETMKSLMNPTDFQELTNRLDTIASTNNAGKQNGQAELEASEAKLNALLDQRSQQLEAIQQQRTLGLMTDEEAARRIDDVNGRFKQSILDATQAIMSYGLAIRDPANAQAIDALLARINLIRTETQNSRQAFTQLDSVIVNSVVNNGVNAFESMASSIADVVTGQASISDGFKGMLAASGEFFASLLRDIAAAIIKQQILRALMTFGGGIGAAAAAVAHNGRVVGQQSGHTRRVSASVFMGAARFHSGGLPGLRADEVPAILQKGEQVLSRDDPNNVLNGGGGGASGSSRFVLVDDRAKVAEAMQSAEGEATTLLHLKRNIPSIKQWLK